MSVTKATKNFSGDQGDLFQQLGEAPVYLSENAPDLNIEQELMGALAYCLREARSRGLSRERVVERMNQCLPDIDRPVTKRQLDAWCAQSKEHHPLPAKMLPALIWAVGGIVSPMDVLARAIGMTVMDEAERLANELGHTVAAKTQLAIRERSLKKRLR